MSEKSMYPKAKFFLYCFLIIGLFASCQPKDTFDWNAAWSAPKYFACSPTVEYFYQGKSIAGASANIGNDPGWGITSGGYVGGEKYKPVPDSIAVNWLCEADRYYYKAGFKLPREKMLELFQKKVIDSYGVKQEYSLIVAGMAPGGNVTIWMQGGTGSTEICKFKTRNKEIWRENDIDYNKFEYKARHSEKYVNSEMNVFRYLHGIPYSVWEKGEKEYDYDIGFSSEEEYKFALTFYTKDGSLFQVDNKSSFLPWKDRFVSYPKNSDFLSRKKKLPVQIHIQWYSQDESRWFNGDIIMPQDLEKKNNSRQFDRLIISIKKDTLDKVIGDIYLINKSKSEKIMSFQLGVYNEQLKRLMAPEYSLPKDFVFPKWEGREPIVFPELDYWQEK
ncbi:DUF2931 family protein [uncultured Flavobacterium sp.]|uniref:DUF2931 family protein n=1 Tax=uncultured Flavobacterium sp. TaxID=165435 RepID=UPI0025ED3820|nr:DUF2931 family protein [uncultured Flavobacterium sp.]